MTPALMSFCVYPKGWNLGIKKEKAVTLNQPQPYVYDSYLLIYGRSATRHRGTVYRTEYLGNQSFG